MKKIKRKIAFLLAAAMLLGMNLVTYAAEQEILAEEVGAKLYRFLATENNYHTVAKGDTTTILAVSDRVYDKEKYEYVNDEHHVYTVRANNFVLTGNTSPDTKLVLDFLNERGFFESFQIQVGADETAEELTISCNLGFWGYYLKNKETGEIFRVTGDDRGEERSITLKVKDKVDDFAFNRSLITPKNLNPGQTAEVLMRFEEIYDETKYDFYNDKEHPIGPGIIDCTVSGNTCSRTRIEDGDYVNTRSLVVDEEEKAEELTVTMTCGRWDYFVKDKTTNEIINVYGGELQPEILTATVKIGGSQDSNTEENSPVSTPASENNSSPQPPAEVQTNTVTFSTGEKQTSTIGGVYQATNVSGIAILTPKDLVESAAGMEAASKNTNIRFYICNGQNTSKKRHWNRQRHKMARKSSLQSKWICTPSAKKEKWTKLTEHRPKSVSL